jgi:putative transposase
MSDEVNGQHNGPAFARVATATGIEILRTPPRTPRQNAVCERFMGSVRRECLDHVLVLGELPFARVRREYAAYFNRDRPHQGLGQATPTPVPGAIRGRTGPIRAVPILGSLHHTYQRAA